MREILTDKREIDSSFAAFRRQIASIGTGPERSEWTFPNGETGRFTTYALRSRHGRLRVALRSDRQDFVGHLFCLERGTGGLSPDVELNVPEALNRRRAGVYLRHRRVIWLGHRGHFNAYRRGIPKDAALFHFEKWLVEANDGGRVTQVIPVAALNSPTLADDLASFIDAVLVLKGSYKRRG